MKTYGNWITAAGLAGYLCLSTAASAQGGAAAAAGPKGEAVVSQVKVTATVMMIDQKTREVTLKAEDGREATFVADSTVKNLAQVKKGDVITATYTEAVAYEVMKKGVKAPGAESKVAAATAAPGTKPAAAVGQKTTVTVTVVAMDPKVPSVTFKGPAGNTRTIKIASADKLKGVNIGDTVDITYAEAIAIKVETPTKK